jgi:signal transduction histidine kinase
MGLVYGAVERSNHVLRTTGEQQTLMSSLLRLMCSVNDAMTIDDAITVCLQTVCDCARWPVGHARLISDGVSTETGNIWYFAANDESLTASIRKEFRKFEFTTLLAQVLADRRAVYTPDLSWGNGCHVPALEVGFRAGLGFPVWVGTEIVAVFEFFLDGEMQPSDLLTTFLSSAAMQLGSFIERTRAEVALRRLSANLLRTQDAERRRLARELHDSAGQDLVALQINLGFLQKCSRPQSKTHQTIKECQEIVKRCISEIRTMSYLLHPPLLDTLGLEAAVRCYVNGYVKRSNILVDVDIAANMGRLEPDVETAFFRIIQESLTNIHRHSGSQTARIRIGVDAGAAFVEVSDSGSGIAALRDASGCLPNEAGVGITGMKERLRELKGTFEILSSQRGTLVRASVPLPNIDRT